MTRQLQRLAACLLTVATLISTHEATANGRFPRAQRLLEQPGDSDRLWLAATYGLLTSSDGGRTWHFVCESSFGIQGAPADPLLELSSAGVLSGLLEGVTLSEDDGCDFQRVFGGSANSTPDISVDRSDRGRVLALLKSAPDGADVVTELHQSLDGGQTFERLGPALPTGFDFPLTVDSAPSDPTRVYLSGVSASNVGQLLRSDDGGDSWQAPIDLVGTDYNHAPFIAAVDPNRADLLFLRTDGRELENGQSAAKDTLLVGDLTGEEGCALVAGVCELFSVRAKLFGFALSPDGTQLLLGLGDPQDPELHVDARFLGLYAGSVADLLAAPAGGTFPPSGFQRLLSSPVSCATWTEKGIYVCTSQEQMGFALGFAPDLSALQTEGLTPLLDLTAVQGPPACPAPASTSQCGPDWESTCEQLGACGDAPGSGGDGGSENSGTAGSAGTAGTGVSAGTAGVGGVPTAMGGRAAGGQTSTAGETSASSGAGTRPRSPKTDSGCRLAVAGGSGGSSWAWIAALLLLRRRRLHSG